MPAAYAHYVFGKKVFQELSGTEKEIIRKLRVGGMARGAASCLSL